MNKKDPICGMEGSLEKHGHYFCSEHCVKKYEKQLKGKKRRWYHERFFQILIFTIVVLLVSYYFTPLRPVFDAYADYFSLIWWAILLGLLISGLIDYYVPREYISKFLAQDKKRTILYATGLGFLMSACSHGILAIAIQLYKKGASVPAVVAFLLGAPWANFTMTILLFGFFGVKALFIIISAIVIAITTGLIFQVLDKKGMIEKSNSAPVEESSLKADLKKRWKAYSFDFSKDTKGILQGMWSLNKMVMWWILLGILMASFARAFVPAEFFHQYMGATLLGLVVTLVLATIIEVCSEGSSPLAFEIFRQTGAFGNAFVFLNAGVSTDATEIGLLWTNIGRKTAIWLPIITVPQIVVLGYLFNLLI